MRALAAGMAILMISLASGCSGMQPAPNESDEPPSAHALITADDVADVVTVASTAHGVVRRLKPEWLRKRSARSTMRLAQQQWEGEVQVYLNGQRMGGPGSLYNISAQSVRQVRYLNAAEATRYGMGHEHGAIMVETW